MNQEQTVQAIASIINRVLADKGEQAQAVGAGTVILGGELAFDSLDLAALVVELDGLTRINPFANGFIHFQTVGELAALYATSQT